MYFSLRPSPYHGLCATLLLSTRPDVEFFKPKILTRVDLVTGSLLLSRRIGSFTVSRIAQPVLKFFGSIAASEAVCGYFYPIFHVPVAICLLCVCLW